MIPSPSSTIPWGAGYCKRLLAWGCLIFSTVKVVKMVKMVKVRTEIFFLTSHDCVSTTFAIIKAQYFHFIVVVNFCLGSDDSLIDLFDFNIRENSKNICVIGIRAGYSIPLTSYVQAQSLFNTNPGNPHHTPRPPDSSTTPASIFTFLSRFEFIDPEQQLLAKMALKRINKELTDLGR